MIEPRGNVHLVDRFIDFPIGPFSPQNEIESARDYEECGYQRILIGVGLPVALKFS